MRHYVWGADGRGGADNSDCHGCRVLHRLQGLEAVQHLELLLLQPRLRQQPQGHLPAEEPDQPLLPQVLLQRFSYAIVNSVEDLHIQWASIGRLAQDVFVSSFEGFNCVPFDMPQEVLKLPRAC